jgi:hypothetical protein
MADVEHPPDTAAMLARASDGRDHEWGHYVTDVPPLIAEIARLANQVRHWQEQEAKQRRLRAEEGRWKHRALTAEGNLFGARDRAERAEAQEGDA